MSTLILLTSQKYNLKMLNPIKPQQLFDQEYRRYARQIILNEVGLQGQRRLKNAKVLCVGAGGLNSSVLLYLVACGIGNIGIIDKDIIEISNLQRQVLYKTDDLKKNKTITAFYELKKLNKNIAINSYNTNLSTKNIQPIFFDYDIIVDGTDNIKTKYIISKYCYKLHKVHIYGAIDKFTGQVSTFNYQHGYTYHELLKSMTKVISSNCNERGLINTLAGITGMLQATEAIKIILGIGSTANDYLIIYYLLNNLYQKTKIRKAKVNERIKIKSQKKILHNYIRIHTLLRSNSYLIIDVRTNLEFRIKKIQKSINIPLNILKKEKYLKNLTKVSSCQIIVCCSNENRSYIASQMLNKYGITHYILKDGINSIRKERDSNPR